MSWWTIGETYFLVAVWYSAALAALILASGRTTAVRAAFVVVLALNALELTRWFSPLVLHPYWHVAVDTGILWTSAFLLWTIPERRGVALGRAPLVTWLTGLALLLLLAIVRTEAWPHLRGGMAAPLGFQVPEVVAEHAVVVPLSLCHDLLFAAAGAILVVRTLPRLLALREGPLRHVTTILVAGLAAPVLETATYLAALFTHALLVTGFAARPVWGSVLVASWAPAGFFAVAASLRAVLALRRPVRGPPLLLAAALVGATVLGAWNGLPADIVPIAPLVPREFLAQTLRPMLIGYAMLRFDLFQAPIHVRRTLVPLTATLFVVAAFGLAHATLQGTDVGTAGARAEAAFGAAALVGALLYAMRDFLRRAITASARTAESLDRRARLQRYILALEQAGPDPSAAAGELGRMRARLGVTAAEHDALATLLADHVIIPTSALEGARPGAVLGGRYRVARLLGTGGEGRVWAAHDLDDGASVVVKEVLEPWMRDASTRHASLRREAETARLVRSPHLAQVRGIVEEPWQTYLVREYVPGRSIDQVVRQEGAMDEERAATILHGVARGLAALHGAGLVHGDIKPSNVVIRTDGIAVLVDQGTTRPTPRDTGDEMTKAAGGALPVSVRWAAPEQHDGRATIRSDIFQLGALYAFMRTGVAPTGRLPTQEYVAAVDGPMRALLAADPEERPHSVASACATFPTSERAEGSAPRR